MDHLVAVEVLCEPPLAIVSVTGYREVEEPIFDAADRPVYGPDGTPAVRVLRRPNTVDVEKGGTAYLDPAETNISALVQAGLVRLLPRTLAATPPAEDNA